MEIVNVRWLPVEAITFWPFILYRGFPDRCLRMHERYHWRQIWRAGVLPWYALYLILGIRYIGKPADMHPLERGAYAAERRCRLGT